MVDEPTQIGSNPQVIANYELGDVLGSGGMATVYEATDRRDGSKVAVKLVHSHLETDADFRERFLREAHVGALLRSPYTCQLLDFGVENSRFYLVMKLIDGEELGDMLRAGPIEPARALKIASQVARALEEAEARGVVHRDIKPSNIMVTEGDMVQVMDFGIARQTGSATITAAGAFVGTLTYAPPEAAGGVQDNRSDIYSLGVTLYHMIAGRAPFEGDMITILQQHREAPLPVEPLEGLPQAVIETIGRCMEKDPNLRFQTASELAGVFEHLAEGVAAGIETISMPETEILQPGAAPLIPSTSVRTMPLVVTMDLGAPQVRRAFLPRTGRTTYDLTFRNNSEQSVELDLQAMDAEGTCSITLPDSVTVPARSGTTVTMSVTPGERRVRGDRQLRQFSVRADAGTGTVPLMAAGEFDDRPEGLFPYAAPPAFAIAAAGIVFAFLSFGGGDDVGPDPAASTTGLGGVVCSPLDTLCFGGRLIFNSERDGNLEIYAMNADGSGEIQRLTDNPGKDGDPSWSPDGSKIVFETDRHGELFEIYTMNADGSGLQRLTISDTSQNQYVNVEPVWSPDGSLIAFTSTRDGNAFIYTMNADGSDVRRLANIPGQGPDWFPDGTRIAFFSIDAASNFDVYVVTIEGGEVVRLTDDAAVDTQPAWSPDGQRIAFQSDRSGNGEIYVMNADGTEPVRLTNNPAEDTEPSWSPDGRQIVFRSSRDGNDDLYTMFADGTGQVRLTSALAIDGQPAWTSGAMPVATRSETGGDLSVQSEVDYFVFNAEEGVTYTLSAVPDTLRDVHLHLWRTASREIKLTDVRGLGADSAELAWTASFSGPVFVSVESYSGQIGEYEFVLRPAP